MTTERYTDKNREQARSSARRRRARRRNVAMTLLLDLLLSALVLGLYLSFKLFVPAVLSGSRKTVTNSWETISSSAATQEPSAASPIPEAAPIASTPPEAEVTPEPTPVPTPDLRSPWQIQFEDFFTAEPVMTENSYTSPYTSIQLSTETLDMADHSAVVHIADIHIAFPEQFYSYVANDSLTYWSVQTISGMDAAAHAILSVSGDCITFQTHGLLMRNGEMYIKDYPVEDICVLYRDGRLATYHQEDYELEALLAEDPVQIWCFGPALLDEEGNAMSSFRHAGYLDATPHPRCAIGYFEPGHYCFIVVDGRREGYSDGLYLPELSKIFDELGCTVAYNLDGGGTAVMLFNHEPYSLQSGGGRREIGDIVVIGEPGFE